MDLIPHVTLRSAYRRALARELPSAAAPTILLDADLTPLPPPVGRFFRACHFVGKPRTDNARFVWSEMSLRSSRDAAWRSVHCEQVDVAEPPTRIALMHARVAGIPLDALDSYEQGVGALRVRLGKVIRVARHLGRYMDESELVTLLAEAVFLPSLALSPAMLWEPLDARSARATLVDHGISVRGTFHFNERDEFVGFESDDRFRAGKFPERARWTVKVHSYATHAGIRSPRELSAYWDDARGEFEYMKGVLDHVEYNVTP